MNVYILNGTVLIQIKKIWLSQEGYIENCDQTYIMPSFIKTIKL